MKKLVFLIILAISGFLSCYDGVIDTYDDSVVYKLRDRGPAGGWIFYINPNYKKDGWRYLEAAPSLWNGGAGDPVETWTSPGFWSSPCPGTFTIIGSGSANTEAILSQNGNAVSAAKLCRDYRGGGFSDWFLPSKDELWHMCWNLQGIDYIASVTVANPDVAAPIGDFSADVYWSSSESDFNTSAWLKIFSNGTTNQDSKSGSRRVRAVRAF